MPSSPLLAAGLTALACLACSSSKPAPKAPEPSAAAAAPVGDPLSADQIASVVNGAHSKVQGCLFLASSPESAGTIAVDFTVAPSGEVSEARAGEATFPDPPVIKCVVGQMRKLTFPTATAPTPATWKFVFGHPDGR